MEQRITDTDAHRGHIKTGSPEYDEGFIASATPGSITTAAASTIVQFNNQEVL